MFWNTTRLLVISFQFLQVGWRDQGSRISWPDQYRAAIGKYTNPNGMAMVFVGIFRIFSRIAEANIL